MITIPNKQGYSNSYSSSSYQPTAGNFALYNRNCISWHSCREYFHGRLGKSKTKYFLFYCPEKKGAVEKFIREFEKRLAILDKVEFENTSSDAIIYVKPGKWWIEEKIRLSLLTILLRCGLNYKGDFAAALYSRDYTKNSRVAIERFMEGNTSYLGKINMWCRAFNGQKKEFVEIFLNKPGEDLNISEESDKKAKQILQVAGYNRLLMEKLIAKALDEARS